MVRLLQIKNESNFNFLIKKNVNQYKIYLKHKAQLDKSLLEK